MASETTQKGGDIITIERLADHNTLDALWIAVHGRVYDLTKFSSDHPGGIEALESSAGADGTEVYEYAGHSEDNMEKMQQYFIGKLEGSHEQALSPPSGTSKSKSSATSGQQLLTPRAKLAIATIATSLLVMAAFPRRYILSSLDIFQSQSTAMSGQKIGYAFGSGIAVASLASLLAFRYLYLLFLSSLDYQNDVFSFPPTIPRKTRR
ncbi:cytochrome b5-like heme/steroid binding domain-containing protein [Mariannaea sp. PMI_226]|nr:cytochrome b5-like heme/steroid binding domain-containing protein [Mariannaea sp. PMI_226]